MSDQILDVITEAEKKAAEAISRAEEDAKQAIEAARRDAGNRIENERRNSGEAIKAAREKSNEKAESIISERKAAVRDEAEKLLKTSEKNYEVAVATVIQEIIG